jgi:hypothetical protein
MIAFLISTLRSLRSRQKSLKNLEANAPKRHRRGERPSNGKAAP